MGQPLRNLMNATIETIIESIDHEPWHAYINNTLAFGGVAMNHKKLYSEIKEVQKNPSLLVEMEKEAIAKFGKRHSTQIASVIFRHVWGMVVYNTSSILACNDQIQKLKDSPAEG